MMQNVSLNMVYHEIQVVRKKLDYLEDILIPEEELSTKELKEIDRLRAEALQEHKKGQTIRVEDL